VILRRDADLPAAVLAGSAWFWGARLAAGALLALGSGVRPAQALTWLGVVAAGWVLAPLVADGAWRRLVVAALLIALPEAIVVVLGRLTRAATLGLEVSEVSVAADAVLRVALATAPLALAAVLVHATSRVLTSAGRRFPT
jgi:hypothetical protein